MTRAFERAAARFRLRAMAAGLASLVALAAPGAPAQEPAGEVTFRSAAVPPTELQLRLARERRHAAPLVQPGLELSGRLSRPRGPGPFPAVVLLHDCDGPRQAHDDWAARLAEWGYIALQVDSFGPRGIAESCTSQAAPNVGPQVFDAFGALSWLRMQPAVERGRVAVMGWGQGGTAALDSLLETGASSLFEVGFAAAVALYPYCPGMIRRQYGAPILILAGGRDDFMPAARCARIATRPETGGERITLVVYEEAHHGFDDPAHGAPHLRPEVLNIERSPSRGATFGYDPIAHDRALERVRRFLGEAL